MERVLDAESIVGLVNAGRISAGRAAEMLKVSIHDIYRLAEKHGVQLGATPEQRKKSRETLQRLVK